MKELGLEKDVVFWGQSDKPEELYQIMDVFIMPSLYEGLPIVAVEAQASGLPCVLSDAITKETSIGGKVSFFSLQDADEIWANGVLGYYPYANRKCDLNSFISKGYGIKTAAVKLMKYYIDLNSRRSIDGQ